MQRAGTEADAGIEMTEAGHIIVWRRQRWETTYLTLRRVWHGDGWDWCTDARCIAGAGPVSVLAVDDDTDGWCWCWWLGMVQTTGRWTPTLRVLALAVRHRADAGKRLVLALTSRQLGMVLMGGGVLCVEMAGAGGAGLRRHRCPRVALATRRPTSSACWYWLSNIVLVAAVCILTARRRRLHGGLAVRACCHHRRLHVAVARERWYNGGVVVKER